MWRPMHALQRVHIVLQHAAASAEEVGSSSRWKGVRQVDETRAWWLRELLRGRWKRGLERKVVPPAFTWQAGECRTFEASLSPLSVPFEALSLSLLPSFQTPHPTSNPLTASSTSPSHTLDSPTPIAPRQPRPPLADEISHAVSSQRIRPAPFRAPHVSAFDCSASLTRSP